MQNKRSPRGKKRRITKVRKTTRTKEEIEAVDVNDRESLEKFVTRHGKILPQRVTGVSAKQQRKIKKTIKQARNKNIV